MLAASQCCLYSLPLQPSCPGPTPAKASPAQAFCREEFPPNQLQHLSFLLQPQSLLPPWRWINSAMASDTCTVRRGQGVLAG